MRKKEEIEVYKIFENEFGEENAIIIMDGLEDLISQNRQEPLESEIQDVVIKIEEDIKQFGDNFTDILKKQSAGFKKWMFTLWVATVVISLGFILAMKYSI